MSDTISVQGNATALRVGRGVASDISVESARAKVLIPRIRLSQMKPHQRTTASLRWGLFFGFKDESTVLGMPVVVTLGDLRSLQTKLCNIAKMPVLWFGQTQVGSQL